MGALLSLLGPVLNFILGLLKPDPQRDLGRDDVKIAVQNKEIADDKVAEGVAVRVDGMSDAEYDELQRKLANRPK